jgi:hypothetical protein
LDVNQSRVDLVFGAVAVDARPCRLRNHRPDAASDCSPGKAIDEWIFERLERLAAVAGQVDQPFRIVSAGVRDGQQDGQLAAQRMDDRGRERRH